VGRPSSYQHVAPGSATRACVHQGVRLKDLRPNQFKEVAQRKTPTIDRIGIAYMLMGEAGASIISRPRNPRRARIGITPGRM